ncbi:MAG TPA: hypothetical protein VK996_11555 [Ramlibacter sp.]|nr:hypothetical protein [Ramlibacter sp.]
MTALTGCALPYLDTAQGAYRVDPVLVQWASRPSTPASGAAPSAREINRCATAPTTGAGSRNASTPIDVLCPLDLDAYVFPQDLNKKVGARQAAYERVLACQETIAPSEFGTSLGHEIDRAISRRKELQQRGAALPAIIKTATTTLDSRLVAQKSAEAVVVTARANLKAANDAVAAAADAAQKDQLGQEIVKAQSALGEAEKKKQTAEAELAEQTKEVESLNAEIARLPELQKQNKSYIEALEKRVQQFGGGGLAPEGTATLLERQEEANCLTLRNQLQEELISRSTQMCEKHLSDIEATASLFNATFGFGALAQSALAAVVTGKTWAQVLSTGAAITTGTQAVINKEVFRNTVVPAIKRAIKAERDRRLNLMRANQLRPLMEYQAGRAVSEAAAYHEACSFSTGLELIGNDAEKRVEQSVPDIEARVAALAGQLKTIDASVTTSTTEAEKRSAERSKLRLRQEIEILQSRLAGARLGGTN